MTTLSHVSSFVSHDDLPDYPSTDWSSLSPEVPHSHVDHTGVVEVTGSYRSRGRVYRVGGAETGAQVKKDVVYEHSNPKRRL